MWKRLGWEIEIILQKDCINTTIISNSGTTEALSNHSAEQNLMRM